MMPENSGAHFHGPHQSTLLRPHSAAGSPWSRIIQVGLPVGAFGLVRTTTAGAPESITTWPVCPEPYAPSVSPISRL